MLRVPIQGHPLHQSVAPPGAEKSVPTMSQDPGQGRGPETQLLFKPLTSGWPSSARVKKECEPQCWRLKGQALGVLGGWVRILGGNTPRLALGSSLAVEGK